ncbi:MAG: aspartate/glutamate racemase family protein [Desulfatibacillum sp.]|nr:aspartate/glutamate racemase family protein [Desulfatibacillum sp.]
MSTVRAFRRAASSCFKATTLSASPLVIHSAARATFRGGVIQTVVWDQNVALYVASSIAARLEAVCEAWLKDLLGLPPQTAVGFVTGTSIATLCGLAAGRNVLLEKAGWDVNTRGLLGAPPGGADRKTVNDIIFQELCLGKVREESKAEFLRIVADMAARGAQAVILGCTEIGMLLDQKDTPVRLYDTTAIHAAQAVEFALSQG